jgi:hypothetical protein
MTWPGSTSDDERAPPALLLQEAERYCERDGRDVIAAVAGDDEICAGPMLEPAVEIGVFSDISRQTTHELVHRREIREIVWLPKGRPAFAPD